MTPTTHSWFSIFLVALSVCLFPQVTLAQYQTDYKPRQTYDENSKSLIASIKDHLQEELDRINSRKKLEISKIYHDRTNYLIGKVKQEVFIHDDTLQRFTEQVLKRILGNNSIHHPPKRILVLKSSEVNAFCYLDGTFVINIGLLAKIKNESQLAFALAHELAHFELDHLRKRITKNVETKVSKTVNREMAKVYGDDVTLAEIDSVKKFIYTLTQYSRSAEKQADSLGFIYFKKAGYSQPEAIALLSVLDSSEYLKYPVGKTLFRAFDFTKFPFKSFWLNQRPRVYSKKSSKTFIFDNDSISSHPDILMRKSILHEIITDTGRPLNYQPDDFVNGAIAIAEFESIESAFDTRQFDRCLFLALEQLQRYPHNSYLISVTSKVMLKIVESKEDGTFNWVVPAYTSMYSDEFRQVNNFVHTISAEEGGEIVFHFLNNQSNFNPAVQDHYYLLWKACVLTKRTEVTQRVKQSYLKAFPKGMYVDKMK